jgi:hypothetical protein
LLVPAGTFDPAGFGWCPSTQIEWRHPAGAVDLATPHDGSDPTRMVFVLRGPCDFLPLELARLHAPGLGLTDEQALAPYAIDDATDELYARRVPPTSLLWLAADNLNALFWGLHDWCHFHNNGPFVDRAWTELQCDASALCWIRQNRALIGLDLPRWEQLREEAEAQGRRYFAAEGLPWQEGWLTAAWLDAAEGSAGLSRHGQ